MPLCLPLSLILALTLTATASGGGRVAVQVDGDPLNVSGAYISQSGTTMVPLRAVAEALGFTVTWNAATRTVGIWSEGSAPAEEPDAGAGGGSERRGGAGPGPRGQQYRRQLRRRQ